MKIKANTFVWVSIGMILCVCGLVFSAPNAEGILKSTDRKDGLCVLINVSDPELAITIAQKSKFVVHVVHQDADAVSAMRKAIDARGLYGRVSVSQASFEGGRLPYAENLVNLVVIPDPRSRIPDEEILRVLAPHGVAVAEKSGKPSGIWNQASGIGKCFAYRKPFPSAMDDWTHFRHDAAGTMVSQDTIVGPPRYTRWVESPVFTRHHALTPAVTVMVSSEGRLFYIMDESPVNFGGLPDNWHLVARDAFNGKVLWRRPIENKQWGDKAWSWWEGGHTARFNQPHHIGRRLVASKNRVFVTLGFNAPITALDSATGKTLIEYADTQYADEIVYRDGVLYVSVNDRPQKALPGKGFNSEPTAQNTSKKMIWAIDAVSGEVRWKAGPYTGTSYVSKGAGRMASMKSVLLAVSEMGVFLVDKDHLIRLNLKDGKEQYQHSIADAKISRGPLVYHKGIVLILGGKSFHAFDAETGTQKWDVGWSLFANYGGQGFYVNDDWVWLVINTKEMKAFNILTGKEEKTISIEPITGKAEHHHRCYPNKSTVNYFISGRRAAEFTNYKTGEVTLHHWARGMCRYGVMPANGLLYKLPDACRCYGDIKLLGFYAMSSADSAQAFFENQKPGHLLIKGEAFAKNLTTQQPDNLTTASSWPTFRHDSQRSSSVKTDVPNDVKKLWDVEIATLRQGGSGQAKITPPVIAGGRVYVSAVDEHKVYALDEKTGKQLWTYIAGGRLDSPPTIYDGRVLFGSADGWVTCLRASDGELAWRFRAAPYERSVMAYGQIESAWPVHGSVLVLGDVVYCTAGRSSFLDKGIYAYALDIDTGKILDRRKIQEDLGEDIGRKEIAASDNMARSDILVSDGKDVYLGDLKLSFAHKGSAGSGDYVIPAKEPLNVGSIFLEDVWYHKVSWKYGGVIGKQIAFDEQNALAVYANFLPKGNRYIYVPEGGDFSMIPNVDKVTEEETGIGHMIHVDYGGFHLVKKAAEKGAKSWENTKYPMGPTSMVIANDKALLAGWVDKIDPSDAWAKIEGRQGGELRMVSMADGSELAKVQLESIPVWNGMAAADEKIFISLKNGKVICLGE